MRIYFKLSLFVQISNTQTLRKRKVLHFYIVCWQILSQLLSIRSLYCIVSQVLVTIWLIIQNVTVDLCLYLPKISWKLNHSLIFCFSGPTEILYKVWRCDVYTRMKNFYRGAEWGDRNLWSSKMWIQKKRNASHVVTFSLFW